MVRLCNYYLPSRIFTFALLDAFVLLALGLATLQPGLLHLHGAPSWKLFAICLSFVGVLLWFMYLFDLYDLDLKANWHETFVRCLRALGCAILLVAPAWWLLAPQHARYQKLEVSLIAFIVLLCSYRLTVEAVRLTITPGDRLLLIGSGPTIDLLAGALSQRHSLPIRLTGALQDAREALSGGPHFATCGTLEDVDAMCDVLRPTRIAVGAREFRNPRLPEKLLEFRRRRIHVQDAISLYETISGRIPVNYVDMQAMALGNAFCPHPFTFRIYRACGAIIACLVALLLSPLLLLIALAIKLDSRGPVFYKQERVGMDGQTFYAFKFRSMKTDAETATGPVWAQDNDPRVTRVGRVLRMLRLDEFAQIWNVVRGEMCLVGPRPERPHFTALLAQKIPYYDVRHSLPPGITGWAQVNASYGASVEESRIKLEYDLFYLNNQSPLLDAIIILKTIKIALFGRGAR